MLSAVGGITASVPWRVRALDLSFSFRHSPRVPLLYAVPSWFQAHSKTLSRSLVPVHLANVPYQKLAPAPFSKWSKFWSQVGPLSGPTASMPFFVLALARNFPFRHSLLLSGWETWFQAQSKIWLRSVMPLQLPNTPHHQ